MTTAFRPSPDFKGLWIPISILIDDQLHLAQRIILAEVHQLQKEEGCFASNAHFCALTGTKERNLRNHLSALVKKGLLVIDNATSKRRRLFVAQHVRDAISAETQEPITKQAPGNGAGESLQVGNVISTVTNGTVTVTNEPIAVTNGIGTVTDSAAIYSDEPGNLRTNPATKRRSTRQCGATENTLRVQPKNTRKKTTNNDMGELDFSHSRKDASTHLLDANGVALSSVEWWDRWKTGYEVCVDESLDECEAIDRLSEMVAKGFDGDMLLRACASTGAHRFWEEPPRGVIPKHLRRDYGYAW